MESFSIRLFHAHDTAAVLDLVNRYASFGGEMNEAHLSVSSYFPSGLLVAVANETIAGFAFGYPTEDFAQWQLSAWNATKVGYIETLVVHPDFRRRGIGRALTVRLLETFLTESVDVVILDCPGESVEARKLYENLGFGVLSSRMSKRLAGIRQSRIGHSE